jgi:hypothetical protein
MIRQNRLEWRGEVTASEMAQLKPGIAVSVEVPNVGSIKGKIRALAPTLDVQSRNGLVYVDLPEAARMACARECSAGANSKSVSTPVSSSPRLRYLCGKASAMSSNWASKMAKLAKVSQVKVQLGRRTGDSLEILSGLNPGDRLVATGASFLTDGDTVQVVQP